jgi:hypothetical protein
VPELPGRRLTRRRIVALAAAPLTAASLAAVLGSVPLPAATAAVSGARFDQPCPAPQSLVRHSHWHAHHLAPGVNLSEAKAPDRTVTDKPGIVDMHVLRVKLTKGSVKFRPLLSHIAERSPLSVLAKHHRHLVAATNTGYFDFDSGAPLGPVFSHGVPDMLAKAKAPIIGFTAGRRPVQTDAWLDGSVTAEETTQRLRSVNAAYPGRGLSLYDWRWGYLHDLPHPDGRHTVVRRISKGRIAGLHVKDSATPAAGKRLLVASSGPTERWLAGLHRGTSVRIRTRVKTDTKHHLTQGYSVGEQLVGDGKINSALGCNERDTQAARTAIGLSKGGKTLIIVVIADLPCIRDCPSPLMHGLDHQQTARVMADLGARWAWGWDGSGSSEMIARLPSTHRLSIRNYCADGEERPQPLGFGIFHVPTRHHH